LRARSYLECGTACLFNPSLVAMTERPPDRLSADPTSPYYDAALLERGVGVRFKGVERNNVEEYCVSERWVRLSVGATRDRRELRHHARQSAQQRRHRDLALAVDLDRHHVA